MKKLRAPLPGKSGSERSRQQEKDLDIVLDRLDQDRPQQHGEQKNSQPKNHAQSYFVFSVGED